MQPSSFSCLLEPWLCELGFSIFYGSVLIKLYKILTEFQTRKAHRVCLRDKDQIVYLSAIVLIVIGYMSAWTALTIDSHLLVESVQNNNQQVVVDLTPAHDIAITTTKNETTASRLNDQFIMDPSENQQENLVMIDLESNNPIHQYNRQRQQDREVAFNLALDESSASFHRNRLVDFAPERLRLLAKHLNSFGDLFSNLLETTQLYDKSTGALIFATRCRKLTWDYVTESSK